MKEGNPMKIKLYRANDWRLDAAEISPAEVKSFEDWNKVDVVIVYDDEGYDWLKKLGDKLDAYTPCDFYSREEIVKHGEYIHSDALKTAGDFDWWNQRWWIEIDDARLNADEDREFYTDITKCP